MLQKIKATQLVVVLAATLALSACDTGYNKESSSSDSSSSSSTSSSSSSSSSTSSVSSNSAQSSSSSVAAPVYNSDSIMGVLAEAGDYTHLLRVIGAAGLANELDNVDLNFTIFAASDSAWGIGDEGNGGESSALNLALGNSTYVNNTIGYHLIENESYSLLSPSETPQSTRVTMQGGQQVVVSTNNDGIFVNETVNTGTSRAASNGLIHFIDKPLNFHDADSNTLELNLSTHLDQDRFNELKVDLASTGKDTNLTSSNTSYTLFAPVSGAYSTLSNETLTALRDDQTALSELLDRHIIPEKLDSLSLFELNGTSIVTAFGNSVTITINENEARINGIPINLPPVVVEGVTIYEIIEFIDDGFTYPTP